MQDTVDIAKDLRARAAEMMAAAKKLLEAADVLHGGATGRVRTEQKSDQSLPGFVPPRPVDAGNLAGMSQPDAIAAVITAAGAPMSRADIFKALQNGGRPMKRENYLSAILSRHSGTRFNKLGDGTWALFSEPPEESGDR